MSQLAQGFNTDANGDLVVAGAVTTTAPAYTSGTNNAISLTPSGAVRTDASGTTQPVSGTVTAVQPTGTNLHTVVDSGTITVTQATGTNLHAVVDSGTLIVTQATGTNLHTVVDSSALPTGAATSALQTTGNSTLSTISGQLPATLGQKTMSNSLSVAIASDQSAIPVAQASSSSATLTSVAGSATSVSLLASNATRKAYTIVNDSTAILYIAFGATASTTAYTLKLFPNAQYVMDEIYKGAVSGIWASAAGNARITELN